MFGDWLIRLITSIPEVIKLAQDYVVWLWLMPLLACWCYLYDGIYIGLMQAKIMRNSMIISTFIGFFPAMVFITRAGQSCDLGGFLDVYDFTWCNLGLAFSSGCNQSTIRTVLGYIIYVCVIF